MSNKPEGVILEFHQIGNQVKVSAFDPVSYTEVCIIGPANATREELSQVAIRKLHYVMEKNK